MAKLPKSLDLAQSFRLSEPTPEPPAVTVEPTKAAPAPTKQRVAVPPGCKSITFYPTREAWLQASIIAAREDRSLQDLMLEALDTWFQERGLQRCARKME